ncbi:MULTISPECIES: helix-turn-helix domain-containing protein [Vibrio]|uniref:helix-turn-helix domain-containing protein n=1 Tax=Vibrio diabolicus TaxID=50719 RepID=UPI00142E825F|nr:helix-turn-helix domain-containing protein [Vibrio diabolicus]MCS0368472.1 helix-turn-helix domain-containing protein [Vibrio diabolicus]MCS0400714.1 helix-turn-helix domain-containing protein [Vibrio diabolicus]MCZ0921653.1 helix-turn-helix domain-containing protein [Vibrio diabolicus]
MDIAEVVKKSGLPTSTLRYYEQLGLIRSIGRNGLRRQYTPEVLNKLNLISLGRIAGISLNEMAEMLNHSEAYIDRDLLAKKALEIDEQIKRLKAVRDSLNHVASCPHESHMDCSSFQKLMKVVKRYVPKKPR